VSGLRATVSNIVVGRRRAAPAHLALNLSYVLHERSDSATVRRVADACLRHAQRSAHAGLPAWPKTVDGVPPVNVDLWLSANVGLPALLAGALTQFGAAAAAPPVQLIDATIAAQSLSFREIEFFRAPATLALPDSVLSIGVAALLLRAGGQTTHLALRGPFAWPAEERAAMRAVERLIQAHVKQWTPTRALWTAPAERLLEDEVQ
jgi:hypothetical protein